VGKCPYCQGTIRLPDAGGNEDTPKEPLKEKRVSWFTESISGLASLLLHTALIIGLALVTCDLRGGGGGEGDEVLIGTLPSENLSDTAAEDLDATSVEVAVQQSADAAESLEVVTPVEADESASRDVNLADMVPRGVFGGGATMSELPGAGGGVGQGASFMGVQAVGRRFCIIADRSGSMEGPKVEYVKQEVLETLTTMKVGGRFQLIFFNHVELPYPKPGWHNPRQERPAVAEWLKTFEGSGGTTPTPAFRAAFELSPRPDVIFFMTDGLFPPNTVQEIAAMNSGERKTQIHTISFMDTSAESLMKQIAADSGGRYRHVSGF
jgi:hypothetical protein